MPFSERLCCTCLGVRPRLMYDKPLNCVPLTQFTKNGLGDAREHSAPGWKLPCHLTSRNQRGKINYPQWCQVETLHGHKAFNIQTQILYDWRSFQCEQKQLGKKIWDTEAEVLQDLLRSEVGCRAGGSSLSLKMLHDRGIPISTWMQLN